MPSLRRTPPSLLAVLLIATALLAIPFHLRPDNFIVDDGYFYPQIARYIAHGQGSTFNGIMPTNGYHPLWMLICVLGAFITSASTPLLQLLTVIQDALTLLSIALLVKICQTAGKRGVILGCAPIVFFSMVLGIWRLLEANLALTLQLCVLVVTVPLFPALQRRLNQWRDPLLGLLLGLTLLARLDLLFFVGIVLAYELLHRDAAGNSASRIRSVAFQSLVVAVVLAPYLLWNLHTFHHLLPVSGAIKANARRQAPLWAWHIDLVDLPVIGAILLNATLLLKRERTTFDALCLITAAAAALHMAYTLSFGGLAAWYLTTGYLTVSLCIVWVVDWVLAQKPSLRWAEPALGSFLFVAFLLLVSVRLFSNFTYTRLVHGKVSFHSAYLEPKRALAIKLSETLPANSRIFLFDAPGGVAYYSGMSILPADGLVADYDYNTYLAREGFAQYAAEHHIDYFIVPYLQPGQAYDYLFVKGSRTAEGQVMQIEAPLTEKISGTIHFTNADLLFRSREITPDFDAAWPDVGVWRIRHDRSNNPG